jgi:predicted dehydrogenase
MKTLGLGIIGLSRRSSIFRDFPPDGARVVAVADLDETTLVACEYEDAFKTADYRELIARPEVDAVCVMTRDYQHVDPAVAALEAGKTVFLEKPMAITIADCDRILAAAHKNHARLFVGHNMRYMPFVQTMKDVIDSGTIGEIQAVWCRHFISYGSCYFRAWCSTREHATGLLLQKGAHDLDVIHWLAGAHTERVIGMGMLSVYDKCARRAPDDAPDRDKAWNASSWPPLSLDDLAPAIDIEDHNMVMLSLANGVQASYTQCFYTPDSERNYTFIGTHGRVENIGDHADAKVHVWTKRGSRSNPDIVYQMHGEGKGHGGADEVMLRSFVAFANGAVEPRNSPVAARQAVAAGVLGHESMRNGNTPQTVPPLARELIEYFATGQKG